MRTTTILALWVLMATASAARAAEVLAKTSSKGKNAFVIFTGSAPITCGDSSTGTVETTVFLSGFQKVTKSRQSPTERVNAVFAQVIQFNSCTGEFLNEQGLVDGAFTAHGLNSATMQALIPLSGFGVEGTLAVDVRLSASGPLQKTRSHSKTEVDIGNGDVIVTFNRSAGKTRDAVATGSLVLDGTALDGTLSDAFLDDSKMADMTILH
jgi:hypothetical protein